MHFESIGFGLFTFQGKASTLRCRCIRTGWKKLELPWRHSILICIFISVNFNWAGKANCGQTQHAFLRYLVKMIWKRFVHSKWGLLLALRKADFFFLGSATYCWHHSYGTRRVIKMYSTGTTQLQLKFCSVGVCSTAYLLIIWDSKVKYPGAYKLSAHVSLGNNQEQLALWPLPL